MMQSNDSQLIRCAAENSTQESAFSSQSNAAFDHISRGVKLFANGITDSMRANKELETEAGSPLILMYRLTQQIPDYITIDIKCSFRWLSCPKKKITVTLPFPSQIKPPCYTKKNDFLDGNVPTTRTNSLLEMCNELIFWTKPTVQSILSDVEQTQGMDKKKIDMYFSAYKLAGTDTERVHVIECLANRYAKHCDYLMSSPDFHTQAVRAKNKMKYYLNCLPDSYLSATDSANKIYDNYQRIFELLSEQNTDEAWHIFDAHAKLSPFIVEAFPHLQAIKHLLHVVFRISGHDKYYGLDEILLIPEHDIVFSVHAELERVFNLLSFDSEQKLFIKTHAIDPIAMLLNFGINAAKQAFYDELFLRREQEIARTREQIKSQSGGMPSYRSTYEDIDAEDEPNIEELTDNLIITK